MLCNLSQPNQANKTNLTLKVFTVEDKVNLLVHLRGSNFDLHALLGIFLFRSIFCLFLLTSRPYNYCYLIEARESGFQMLVQLQSLSESKLQITTFYQTYLNPTKYVKSSPTGHNTAQHNWPYLVNPKPKPANITQSHFSHNCIKDLYMCLFIGKQIDSKVRLQAIYTFHYWVKIWSSQKLPTKCTLSLIYKEKVLSSQEIKHPNNLA